MVTSTLLNPVKLDILRQLRESAGLTQTQAAHLCGLTSKQGRISLGAWEQGKRIPHATRRQAFIAYLWDHLGLRKDPIQFDAVWTILVEEWGWEPIGDREWDRFTHVERSTTIQQSSRNGVEPLDDCGEKPISPFQAPATVPHFVGRQEELTLACERLRAEDGPPIVAFVGMGGIGKTTLAIHAAHALRGHFADGVLWASAAITNPLDIAQSWATAYGYDFSGLSDLESRAAAIRNVLNEKHALIIFDDVIDTSTVRPLLPSSNENGNACRVLITTRNHDIASTLNAHPIAPPELATQAGVELLTRVLGAPRVEHEFAAAERICQIVEGLPLAVEIVAQRLLSRPQQTLGNMVTRLEDSSQRLGLEISDRAIRAAFEVSWAQLNDEQKEVFSQMGVFEGRSFAIPALAYIGERSEAETEDLVWGLQALSLVGADGDERYRQHPLLADFAGEGLGGGDGEGLIALLSDYYQKYALQIGTNYFLFDADIEMIAHLVQLLEYHNKSNSIVFLVYHVKDALIARGRYDVARNLLRIGADSAALLGRDSERSRLLISWGYVCSEQTDYEEAKERLNAGLEQASAVDFESVADGYFNLARIAVDEADYEEANEYLDRCRSIREQIDDELGVARVGYFEAQILLRIGEYERAYELAHTVYTLQKRFNAMPDLAETLRLLIDISNGQHNYENAWNYCKTLLFQVQKGSYRDLQAEAYFCAATICRYRKQLNRAHSYAEQSLAIFESLGNRAFISYVTYEISVILYNMGDLRAAIKVATTSLNIMEVLNDRYSLVFCLQYIGDIHRDLNNLADAHHHWARARELALEIHHPRITLLNERLEATLELV